MQRRSYASSSSSSSAPSRQGAAAYPIKPLVPKTGSTSGVRPPLQMTLDQGNRVRNYYERDVRLLSGRLNEDFDSAWFSNTDSSRGAAPLIPQDSGPAHANSKRIDAGRA